MDEELRGIEQNVAIAIEQLGPLSDIDFGLNRPSVVWVEGFIERQRARPGFDPDDLGAMPSVLGAFLGGCIVANSDGRWDAGHGSWSVRFPNGSAAFPLAKVQKQFRNGVAGGDSIVSFYDIALAYVATGRLGER